MAEEKSTKGVLLHRFDHSDNSAILKVLTPDDGCCSLIWKGAKKRKKGPSYGSIALPLNRLEISARFKGEDALHLLKEVRVTDPFQQVLQDPVRSSIALFLSEFLYRTTPLQAPDPSQYQELEQFIEALDRIDDPKDLHLHFIARSMLYQGIAPESEEDEGGHFDLLKGTFQEQRPEHEHYLKPLQAEIFGQMLATGPDGTGRFLNGRKERQDLLGKLIEHHRIHLGAFGTIRSLEVLQELFSEEAG
jgi:DNA repair protein RecO (recombination protein O)